MTAPRLDLITGPVRPLTKQEQRVCDGIYRRLRYAQIGVELGALENRPPIAERTVRAYVASAAAKFDGLDFLDPCARIYIAMLLRVQHAA